jgi:thiol-disulfide isomerase/thioredoxin
MSHRYNPVALVAALCWLGMVLAPAAVHAQKQGPALAAPSTAKAVESVEIVNPVIVGSTLEKKSFSLAQLKGKVVLVMFWSTDCAVCRDKMPELRENVQGWTDKPFEMVLVSVDRSMRDVDSYNAIINKSVPLKQRFTQLWTGDASYKDNLNSATLSRSQLPMALLIGKDGKVVERFTGRIPADVWDKIADLL